MVAVFVVFVIAFFFVMTEAKSRRRNKPKKLKLPYIPHYDFLGPFPVGKTEIDGDPAGGFDAISRLNPSGSGPLGMISEMVDGGQVRWKRFYADRRAGLVNIHFGANDNVSAHFLLLHLHQHLSC